MIPVLMWVSAGLLLLSGALSVIRIWLGPGTLDRVSALDVLAAAVLGITIIMVVFFDRQELAGLMIVFVLSAFFSAVIVARSSDREG